MPKFYRHKCQHCKGTFYSDDPVRPLTCNPCRSKNPIWSNNGRWFWGSRGPFKSREKASQVARGAYASGYKGTNPMKRCRECGRDFYSYNKWAHYCPECRSVTVSYKRNVMSKSNLYKKFHGVDPVNRRKVSYQPPKPGEELLIIGKVTQINYQPEANSQYHNTEFYHKSGDTGSRMLKNKPVLACSKDGKRIYLIPDKSKARFTERGIIG